MGCQHYRIDSKTNICSICEQHVPPMVDPLWFNATVERAGGGRVILSLEGASEYPLPGQRVLVMVGRNDTLEGTRPRPTRAQRVYNILDYLSTAGLSRSEEHT